MKHVIKKLNILVDKITASPKKKVVSNNYSDFSDEDNEIVSFVKPYTMTSPERIKALLDAVRYVANNNIEGDYVECGVWKGGSTLAVAKMFSKLNKKEKTLWLYDTFEGMSEPTKFDLDINGKKASDRLKKEDKKTSWVWALSELEEVKKTMKLANYPKSKIKFIKGKVEDTLLEANKPNQISILRLDTDWYESTKIELELLYPKVVKGGIIIIDDYGHWKGSKKAVDEYIDKNNLNVFLNRIDYTGRLIVKQ
ncbi:macrocin O-methyltransferase [Flavivirga aquatica]|uniref:Macrocin O-methyltransferase n=1 Tax=Flavivirga aquatica TaxID=1849968 RepID=A0A1E5TBX7_9FLAO|nr:TylF/MycF/NovP-related O-methyltransferase [Flavivirga aquatica]OEK08837.1 macrocin O-methyltransferase [Flavivirga aquatica]